jgi:Fur family ferric uptake transcriptional regulator
MKPMTHNHHHDVTDEARDEHRQRLRDAGYKLTRARLTVLDVIEDSGGHITSANVLSEVERRDSSIGRASIFRTLDLLTRLNIVRPTYLGNNTTPSYVLMPDGHHHHVVCISCNRIIEFDDCGLSDLKQKLEARYGLHIIGHLLEFYGECETCLQQQETNA